MTVATLRVLHATAVSGRPGQMDRSSHADRVWGKAKRISATLCKPRRSRPTVRVPARRR